MKNVFDIIEAVEEKVAEFLERCGRLPNGLALSPGSYRRLIEIRSTDFTLGNLIVGCLAMNRYEAEAGCVNIVIDELLPDTSVEVF